MPSRYPERLSFARQLRQANVPAEKKLWREIRANKLGFKFRRQHPIGSYFADFACCAAMIVIELDGNSHVGDLAVAKDARRSEYIQSNGWHVLRFTNPEVHDDLEMVVEAIYSACARRIPTAPSP